MEEKKLTDEQLIHDLEEFASDIDMNETGIYTKILDLIHRLQSENAEQKAEIERLTEEIDGARVATDSYLKKVLKLQKQVDELLRDKGFLIADLRNARQAVKDTAKEIYSEIGDDDILVISTQEYGKIEVVPLERLQEIVKGKGVEVE